MANVSVYNARAEFSRLIERALAGEEIVITRRGKPAVRLVPVEQDQPKRKLGALKGLFEVTDDFFEPLPDDLLDAFYNGSVFPEETRRRMRFPSSGREAPARYPHPPMVAVGRSEAVRHGPRCDRKRGQRNIRQCGIRVGDRDQGGQGQAETSSTRGEPHQR